MGSNPTLKGQRVVAFLGVTMKIGWSVEENGEGGKVDTGQVARLFADSRWNVHSALVRDEPFTSSRW